MILCCKPHVVAFTASNLSAKQVAVSFQNVLMFVLISTPNVFWTFICPPPPHGALFTRRPGLVLKCYKLAKDAHSTLKTSSTWVSLSQPTQFVFHYNEHLQLCPPFKRIKVYLSPFVWEQTDFFFANRTWGHFFCLWPSEPPMNFVDIHPLRTHKMCWIFYATFTVKLCQTVLFFFPSYLDYFCRVECLLKC